MNHKVTPFLKLLEIIRVWCSWIFDLDNLRGFIESLLLGLQLCALNAEIVLLGYDLSRTEASREESHAITNEENK